MNIPEFKQNLQFLILQRHTLFQMGIDLNVMKGKDLLKNYWKFTFLIGVTIYLEYSLINSAMHSNIDDVAGSLSMFNQGILILVKMFTFLYKGDYFIKLIWEMNNLAEKARPKEFGEWLLENRRSQLIGNIYNYICWATVGCAGLLPISFVAYDYYNENEIIPKLPFGGKFPYDNGSLLYFILNYILSMVYIYALLNMTVGVDSLFGWFVHNVAAHFRILRTKIENTAIKLEEDDCINFTKDIASIVCYHNKILQFVKDLNGIFGYILWAEVMFSCMQICLIIYALNNDADISKKPFNFLTSMVLTVQLTIYCFGGDKVRTENDMLCMDFYLKFPWHKMSIKEKKLVLLPLMRSQRPSTLRGVFFELDRSLLVYMVKTAFSFNAFLSAMKE